jgi:hypothetical protein
MTENESEKQLLELEDYARMALDEAAEALGSDIALLDLRGISQSLISSWLGAARRHATSTAWRTTSCVHCVTTGFEFTTVKGLGPVAGCF